MHIPQPALRRAIEILLVDDDTLFVHLVANTLSRLGRPYRLTTLESGDAALDWLTRNVSDAAAEGALVLLDLNLPGMDGPSLLGAIRASAALRDMRVIVLSGSRSQADVSYAAEQRALFIAKPVDPETLLARVRQVLGGAGAATPSIASVAVPRRDDVSAVNRLLAPFRTSRRDVLDDRDDVPPRGSEKEVE